MKQVCAGVLVCALSLIAAPALAQVSITGVIAGTVTDGTDSVLPGATVVLKDEGTGVQRQTTTNEGGSFAFRDLSFGSYEVTVNLQGFQAAQYKKVVVESGRTTDLRIRMAVGAVEEVVTVEGSNPVLEMTSNAVSTTLNNKLVTELPLAGRNAFTFARLVPGAVAPQGTGSTHYNGMPGGVINPTIDGVNNSSNGFKSGGTSFFGTVPARLGAVEEVTVETAGLGGDSGVTGGVNLKFVTRRGTNQYRGSGFEQYRTEKLNANSFSNERRGLPEAKLRRHDFGGNFGGPLVPSGSLRSKLFFFANYEQEYIPQTTTRSQTILTTEAQQGIFRYVDRGRRTADDQRAAARGGQRLLRCDRPGDCQPALGAGELPQLRGDHREHERQRVAPPGRELARAAEADQLLPDRPRRLPHQAEPQPDEQLQPLQSGRAGTADLADARVPGPGGHVRLRLVGDVDRLQLDAGREYAQRVPVRHPAQRGHQRTRPRVRTLLPQRRRQRSAGTFYVASWLSRVVERRVARHRQALHHDDLRHVHLRARNPHL